MASGVVHATSQTALHPLMTSRFEVYVGSFFPDRRLRLGVNGSSGDINSAIDFNSELRVKESDSTYSIDLSWRVAERWRLFGQYFESDGGANHTLQHDVPWKDVVFPRGSDVSAGSDFSVLNLFVGRALETRERHDFGLGFGVHVIEVGAFVAGTAVDENGVPNVRFEAVSVRGPLPNIGAWYRYSMTPRWALRSRLDWVKADVGKYDGSVLSFSLGLNFRLSQNIGIGVDYKEFKLDVAVNESGWRGHAHNNYEGFNVNISAYW